MSSAFLPSIDALALWRRELDRGIDGLARQLADVGLVDTDDQAMVASLRQRLANDRMVLAFVAEFSRGKSELINALFFSDGQRRVMPATPGRTTMCPVELAWDPQQPSQLLLLPIETRGTGHTVGELRSQPELWRQILLPPDDAEGMARALDEVTRTRRVTVDEARMLGFWSDERPGDNPPRDAHGRVEVPAWRHALLNYAHPLLRRGLVVIDTPGLNAVGAEPELTLSLLPMAHATVFVLAADTGVTRADLDVWREHLGDRASERYVVLNKIDTLDDPLGTPEQTEAHLQRQCDQVAQILEIDRGQIYPLSARAALAARVRGDEAALAASRLPQLEDALLTQLLPRRGQVIGHMVDEGVQALQRVAMRRLSERQRRNGDHLAELNGLRGKSMNKLQRMTQRLDAEAAQFERCTPRLNALRAVVSRESKALLEGLSSDQVREAVQQMRIESQASLFNLGAGRAFANLCDRLRSMLDLAKRQVDEMDSMLRNSIRQLNAEAGLALTETPRPVLDSHYLELDRVQSGYSHYVGITQVWRLGQSGFMEQFSRTLQSRLRVVFEGLANEIEAWVRKASAQMDEQLRDHRRALRQRREAHARIRAAESGLERSIDELLQQQSQLQQVADRLVADVEAVRRLAAMPPSDAALYSPRLRLVSPPPTLHAVVHRA
jgi:Dynamin family